MEEGRSEEDSKEPRDSGCFEISESLEGGREEPKTEEELQNEASDTKKESEQQEEQEAGQLEVVQEQLQELRVDEGPSDSETK